MGITYNWDTVTQAFEGMYRSTKNGENQIQKDYSHHASGMLKLIPQIRDFPEFAKFDLNISMGILVCASKSSKGGLRISCGENLIYHLEIYDPQQGYLGIKKLDAEQVIPELKQLLTQIANE